MSDITYRVLGKDEEGKLLALYCAAYDKEMSPEWWHWWRGSPAGTTRTYVAVDGDKLVGAYSLAPFRLWLNSRVISASLCNNVATHPDYQRKGIFSGLGRFALHSDGSLGIPLSIGMPNAKALPGHLSVGWTVASLLPQMVKVDCERTDHSCRTVADFDSRFHRLQARMAKRFSFLPIRSASELHWRYLARPGVTYTVVVVDDYPEIHGYAVLKRFGAKAHIVDLHAETDAALHELLNCATDYAAGSTELTLYSNHRDPYRATLETHGFTPRQEHDRLILHGNIGQVELPSDSKGWAFPLGSNDVY